eukprot:151366_1
MALSNDPPSYQQHVSQKRSPEKISEQAYREYMKQEGKAPNNAFLLMNFARKYGQPLNQLVYSDARDVVNNPPSIYRQNTYYSNDVMQKVQHVMQQRNMGMAIEGIDDGKEDSKIDNNIGIDRRQPNVNTDNNKQDNIDWKSEYDKLQVEYQGASMEIFRLRKENKELQDTIQMMLQSGAQFANHKSAPSDNRKKPQNNRHVKIIDQSSDYKEIFDDDFKADFAGGRQRSLSNPFVFANLNDFDCMICLESKSAEYRHIISNCGHTFCRDCLRGHILNYNKPELPDCPLPKCTAKMADHIDIQVLITEKEYRQLHEKIDKVCISKLKYLKQCLTPDCKYAIELIDGIRLNCPVCKKNWCTECQVEWHSGITCGDYKKQEMDKEIKEYNKWKESKSDVIKACPSCHNDVEKNGGCNHMRCVCGSHWCWVCGVAIDGNNVEGHFNQNHPIFRLSDVLNV